jgi:hypothetical protein
MRRRHVVSVCLLATVTGVASLGAQVANGRAAIRGTITDQGGRAIAGARVVRTGTSDTTRADSLGRYAVEHLALGRYIFAVRAPGYTPIEMEVTFSNDTSITQDIPLESAASSVSAKLDRVGFAARQRAAAGATAGDDATFLTMEEVAAKASPRVTGLFEHVRGVTLRMERSIPVVYGFDGRCVMNVWLEGRRAEGVFPIVTATGRNASQRSTTTPTLDQLLQVGDIAAIEVYPRPSRVPPQFQSSTQVANSGNDYETRTADCGAIVIWTTQDR